MVLPARATRPGGSLTAAVVTGPTPSWNLKQTSGRDEVPSPRIPGGHVLSLAVQSRGGLWAAGYSFASCLIMHWDGASWNVVATPDPPDCILSSVAAVAGGRAFAIGTWGQVPGYVPRGLILRWDGKAWT